MTRDCSCACHEYPCPPCKPEAKCCDEAILPCTKCGEEPATITGTTLCRDCDIETCIKESSCEECDHFQYNEWAKKHFRIKPPYHAPGCSKEPPAPSRRRRAKVARPTNGEKG
jgi:hypothetical protein